jgi:hypothetical protein
MHRVALVLPVLLLAACEPEKLQAHDLSGEVEDLAGSRPDLAGTHCADDTNCMNPMIPRCDQRTGMCVACQPTNDNCPEGTACTDANGTWACADKCTNSSQCPKLGTAGMCCGGLCIDTSSSASNCGGCNNACPDFPNGVGSCSKGVCGHTCNAGFGDCDGLPFNGCETDTNGDAKNCGACGMVCSAPVNSKGTCAMGTCGVACASGFVDCDKMPQNGCEVDATSDIKNCGMCGNVCKVPANAVAFCNQGQCSFQCLLGFANCDNNAANGCEADVKSNDNNCGHCGNVCPILPNAGGGCVNSQCTVGQCNQGWGDCDRNPQNGCETPTDTDQNNCGGCGKGCKPINGGAVCAAGQCTLSCNQNYSDCNNDANDGCEASLLFDGKNCNGCGNVCPMNNPACVNGVCGQLFSFTGIQTNLPVANLAGWKQCYVDGYANSATSLATIQQMCPGGMLLIGCRVTGANTLTAAAMAPRADVLFDTGGGQCNEQLLPAPHVANGVAWYYNSSWSWGFFHPGDGVSRCSCDTAFGVYPQERMCWHTGGGNINSGYRCGSATGIFSNTYERVVYQAN